MKISKPLVSVQWLAEHLGQPGLVILDATMDPVGSAPLGKGDQELQIPGSQLFDLKHAFSDTDNALPHMMPGPEQFTASASALGITSESVIIIYDRSGIFSSPRAWWMFRAMGHSQVAVLDGGFPEWRRCEYPTEKRSADAVIANASSDSRGEFVVRAQSEYFCDAEAVTKALADKNRVVLDARSPERFSGHAKEPRPGMRSGHMPGAYNIPWSAVQESGRMRSAQELAAIFDAQAGNSQQLVLSCGSGVTACVLALAAEIAGRTDLCVYDGSWSEWGAQDAPYPVETSD